MVELIITDDKLTLALPESDDYYVKPLEFPWKNITGAKTDTSNVATEWYGRLMFFSAAVPDVVRPGVYYEDGKNVFWGIDNPEKVIGISLKNEPYETLYIEVENQQEAVETIENALKGKKVETTESGDAQADGAGEN